MALFEKFYIVTHSYEASTIIEARTSNDAERIFQERYDGQDIEPTQVPPEAAIQIEPLPAKPAAFRKDLIEQGFEDDVYILRDSKDEYE